MNNTQENIRYRAFLKIEKFKGHKDVCMTLLKDGLNKAEKNNLPQLIKDFNDLQGNKKLYAESVAEELFTQEEINEMKPYFESFVGTKLVTEKIMIPENIISENGMLMGVGANAAGGLQGFYEFNFLDNYPLSFKVCGYYDLRQHEEDGKASDLFNQTIPIRILITENPAQLINWARENAKGAFHLTFDELIREDGGKGLNEVNLIHLLKELLEKVKVNGVKGINLIVSKEQSLMIPASFKKYLLGSIYKG